MSTFHQCHSRSYILRQKIERLERLSLRGYLSEVFNFSYEVFQNPIVDCHLQTICLVFCVACEKEMPQQVLKASCS